MIGNFKVRNERLTETLDLNIFRIVFADRNGRIDDVRDHHHILEDDLVRFLLNGVELLEALSHRIDLCLDFFDLCHLGGIFLGLSHEFSDLFGEFLSLRADLICLALCGATLFIIFNYFIDKGKFHILKLFANILFDDFRIFSQKLNINHFLSPSLFRLYYCITARNIIPCFLWFS